MLLLFIIIYIACYKSQPPTEHQRSLFVRSGQSSSKGTTVSALLKNRLPLYKATNLSVAFQLTVRWCPIQIKSVTRLVLYVQHAFWRNFFDVGCQTATWDTEVRFWRQHQPSLFAFTRKPFLPSKRKCTLLISHNVARQHSLIMAKTLPYAKFYFKTKFSLQQPSPFICLAFRPPPLKPRFHADTFFTPTFTFI